MKNLIVFVFCLSTFIGLRAQTTTTFGTNAGTLGTHSSFFGYAAGQNNTASGSYNTFLGYISGRDNTTGVRNTFVGALAGLPNTTGSYNTCVGMQSGTTLSAGGYNSYFGYQSGQYTTEGKHNVYLGFRAGKSSKTTSGNVAVGNYSGDAHVSGNYNTFIGYGAAASFERGQNNVFLGKEVGAKKSGGDSNVILGSHAGEGNEKGSGNVFIGYKAAAGETGSNLLYIDNSSTDTPLIYGKFNTDQVGINTNEIPTGYTMAIDGKVMAEEVRVQLSENWPDYVFDPGYELRSIKELKKYVEENKHLPEIPSAKELEEEGGVALGEMNRLLLKKIEEMSLYIIELKEEVDTLNEKVEDLEQK